MRLNQAVQMDTSTSGSSDTDTDTDTDTTGPSAEMVCPECTTHYALDGRAPRYYCPDCGARLEVRDNGS